MDSIEVLKRVEKRDKSAKRLVEQSCILKNEISKTSKDISNLKYVANNSRQITLEIDREFESQTSLKGVDYGFLFLAIALQCTRIYLIDKYIQIEKAGQNNVIEQKLHDVQKKIFDNFDSGPCSQPQEYYAPKYQILTGRGVPYDATGFVDEKYGLFKGANHRFATLGHEPLLGLIFGTTNILTNTITCYDENARILGIKIPVTNHVIYDNALKNPRIGHYGLTTMSLYSAAKRLDSDKEAVAAALIKQIIHIGTDMYTPCGISLPFCNLVLSKQNVEYITKYISVGDVVKVGASASMSVAINYMIGILHNLLYDRSSGISQDVYNVKTSRIISLSNLIASTSDVISTAMRVSSGNLMAVKTLDWGGLLITIYRLIKDNEFIRQVKHEFLVREFIKRIYGDDCAEIKNNESLVSKKLLTANK